MEWKEKWKKWFRRDNLLIVILSGVLLFIITLPIGEDSSDKQRETAEIEEKDLRQSIPSQTEGTEDFTTKLEAQLEAVLTEMEGVGRVRVMITLKSSEELVVEKEETVSRSNTSENDSAGGSRIVTQVDSGETTVYNSTGSDSKPYVIKTLSPQVEGVVVVAQGAGDGTVNKNITEMVQALFDVEAHKVKVVKMTSTK